MAVFIKIRNKFGVIIAVVIGLMLAVFVLESALNSNTNLLKGRSDTVIKIDGHKIAYSAFEDKVKNSLAIYKVQQKKEPDEAYEHQQRDQTYEQMVNEYLNNKQYDGIGLRLTDDEFADMIYSPEFANDQIKSSPSFTNPQTKQFDPKAVKDYVDRLEKDDPNGGQTSHDKTVLWEGFEDYIKSDRLSTKYKNLVKGASYTPKWIAEMDYIEKNTKQDVSLVLIPYATISDSNKAVKVTDVEIQNYINAHKEQFKQDEPTRKLDYVIWTVVPSSDDTAEAKKTVFKAYDWISQNPNDTAWLKKNTDQGGIDKHFYAQSDISSMKIKDTLSKIKPNTLVGPYFENGFFKLAIVGEKDMLPDSVETSHIYISMKPGDKDSVKILRKADSLLAVIKKDPKQFGAIAKTYSDDKDTKDKDGKIGFLKPTIGTFPKNFSDFVFKESKKGEIKLLKLDNGYHIVRIDSTVAKTQHMQVNMITKEVRSSEATFSNYFNLANAFSSKNNTPELFLKAKKETGGTFQPQSDDNVTANKYTLPGFNGDSRKIVQWAFAGSKNDVSQPILIGGVNYTVALLTDVRDGDLQSVDQARNTIEPILRNEKKATILMKQLVPAIGVNATIESVASKINQPLKNASDVTFGSPSIDQVGFEPKVVGVISALPVNVLSKPIAGTAGVFVVIVTARNNAQAVADYKKMQSDLTQQRTGSFEYYLPQYLKKSVKIEDDRYLFY